jgi:threonine dehydrogenase-like Zn-dependent dehydrogenase
LRVLITQRFPLARAPEAIDFALHHPAEAAKVLLTVRSAP